jgi:hypothetical protein
MPYLTISGTRPLYLWACSLCSSHGQLHAIHVFASFFSSLSAPQHVPAFPCDSEPQFLQTNFCALFWSFIFFCLLVNNYFSILLLFASTVAVTIFFVGVPAVFICFMVTIGVMFIMLMIVFVMIFFVNHSHFFAYCTHHTVATCSMCHIFLTLIIFLIND